MTMLGWGHINKDMHLQHGNIIKCNKIILEHQQQQPDKGRAFVILLLVLLSLLLGKFSAGFRDVTRMLIRKSNRWDIRCRY